MASPFELPTFGNSLLLRVDGAIGAMSLSPTGRDAVLAGRRGLFIIDLDDPFTTPRWLHHITLWEVADVQWLPHSAAKPLWCISTSNQKALLWDLARPSNNAIVNVLHCHSRAITDINFHPQDAELLATCSIDTFVYCWDMRTPRRPVEKFAEWRAGATQVKWSHSNPYQVALAHDHGFSLWDSRKGASPLIRVEHAHMGKISGLDFSGGNKTFLSCSFDGDVKLWDLSLQETVSPSVIIKAQYPVAKARVVPFGDEKSCGIMPLRRGENAIHIVNFEEAYRNFETDGKTAVIGAEPDYSFKGHTNPIKDFLWRTRQETYVNCEPRKWKEYQLVTWSSQDYDLKLWQHEKQLYDAVSYNPLHQRLIGVDSDADLDFSVKLNSHTYSYNSYTVEPPLLLSDVSKETNGDVLSTLALFRIRQLLDGSDATKLNHLSWILGVRMGSARSEKDSLDGPSNLGEEVSIVGHKFSKMRFEKISVSTGHLVISLKGPPPQESNTPILQSDGERKDSVADLNASLGGIQRVNLANVSVQNASSVNAMSINATQNEEREENLVFIRLDIRFPKLYPQPDEGDQKRKKNQDSVIKFSIEETHELSASKISIMLNKLNEIAQFYYNKHHKFCLEPCLRYLMGDVVDMEDDMMLENTNDKMDSNYFNLNILEVGSEDWADDLINQHETAHLRLSGKIDDEEDDEFEDEDLIALPDLEASADLMARESKDIGNRDSTPLPKGCGAVWGPSGKLVCFFLPQAVSKSDKLSLNVPPPLNQDSDRSRSGSINSNELDSLSSSGTQSDAWSESFADDWDEMFSPDMTLRARVPAMFKSSVFFGSKFISEENYRSLVSHTISGLGTGSNNLHLRNGESVLKGSKRSKVADALNFVTILDFSHLIPEKYVLALDYKIFGDDPDKLAHHNADVALKNGCKDLANSWKVIEIILASRSRALRSTVWGSHPFGHTWLVKELFRYYEQKENTQMLAMMACILQNAPSVIKDDNAFELTLTSIDFPSSLIALRKNDSFSSDGESKVKLSTVASPTGIAYTGIAMNPLSMVRNSTTSLSCSPHSKNILWNQNLGPNFHIPEQSPSEHYQDTPFKQSRSYSKTRSNTSQGPLQKGFNQTQDVFTSQKENKSFSTEPELMLVRASNSIDNMRRPSKSLRKKPFKKQLQFHKRRATPSVEIEMRNNDTLDFMETSGYNLLLGSLNLTKVIGYREHYAELLYSWGLHEQRVEVLKHNQGKDAEAHRRRFHECHYLTNSGFGYPIEPTKFGKRVQICALCELMAQKRVVLCLRCEHVLHLDCASEWWDNELECPSGCGCKCIEATF